MTTHNKDLRPTPRTDAVWQKHTGFSPKSAADAYELAGNLERELDEATHQLAETTRQRDDWRAEAERWREMNRPQPFGPFSPN